MNPRYPTSNQFRRRRNKKPGRPILLGLLALLSLYFIFSPSSKPPPVADHVENPAAPIESGRFNEAEFAQHLQESLPPAAPPPLSNKKVDASPNRRLAVMNVPAAQQSVTSSPFDGEAAITGVGIPGPRFVAEESVPDDVPKYLPTLVPPKSLLSAAASRPPAVTKGERVTNPLKLADLSSDNSEPENSVPLMPSAPTQLAPKPRPPGLDMTFYRELPRRKVIVPMEEPVDSKHMIQQPVVAAVDAHKPTVQTTPETTEKPTGTGSYVVQLAVFNNGQRAETMAATLQQRGVPAKVVKSKSGSLYRIRLGPFASHSQASKSLVQWKLGGYSSLIFQDKGD